MSRIPWFTPADYAEFDVLIKAFVDGFWKHRDQCAVCAEGGPCCEWAVDSFEALLEWRQVRQMQTKAEHLRAKEAV